MNANKTDMNKRELPPNGLKQAAAGEGDADTNALYVKLATKVILAARETYGRFFTQKRAMIYLDFAHNDFYIPHGIIPRVREAIPVAWAALGLPAGE